MEWQMCDKGQERRDGGKGRVRNLIRHEKELKGKQGSVNKLECVFVRESMSHVLSYQ